MLRYISLFIQATLYVLAGLNHFRAARFYLKIMPHYFPFPLQLVYISGGAEILLGILALVATTRSQAFFLIALMLAVYIPVHIYLIEISPFKLGSLNVTPLLAWGRLLLQVPLILWALWQGKYI